MKALQWVWERYHYVALGFWVLAIFPTLFWWRDSVLWVSMMSLYANIWISLQVLLTKKDNDA